MTSADTQPVRFPRERAHPLDPPVDYDRMRADGPVVRLRLADDQLGWLVIGQAETRAMLADRRFSAERTPGPVAVREVTPELVEEKTRRGAVTRMDPPEHTRYRRLLNRHFSPSHLTELVPRIEQIAAERLAAMITAGAPADLVSAFAAPMATQVICELLGVSYADREIFWAHARTLMCVDTPRDQLLAHYPVERAFMQRYIDAKRREPGEDLLSALAAPDSGLDDDELTGLGNMLLMAGHEQPTNMIALAVVALLEYPEQFERLCQEPSLIDSAVEELLRYLSILHLGTPRTATEQIELGGQVIQPGELVIAALPAANRDPATYPDPHGLDISRPVTGHVAFGYGIHRCLGQHLTRIELRIALTQLTHRLPTLRLATALDRIPFRDNMFIYGAHELSVAWTESR
ncbi:cytochrome P450 [Nocardia sp. NPDC050378]|uniref:cytochrome P450 n=1 Tax=Nocardia sp. NPDC050378 TaxID=3155400 RepID=UPI0033C70E4E